MLGCLSIPLFTVFFFIMGYSKETESFSDSFEEVFTHMCVMTSVLVVPFTIGTWFTFPLCFKDSETKVDTPYAKQVHLMRLLLHMTLSLTIIYIILYSTIWKWYKKKALKLQIQTNYN